MRDGFAIVDADGHLAEPADVFDGRMDEQYLERAPRILRTAEGRQGMSFLGKAPAVGMFGSGDAIVPGSDRRLRLQYRVLSDAGTAWRSTRARCHGLAGPFTLGS